MSPTPELSIIIPVYNEEAIVEIAVRSLVSRLDEMDWDYELLIAENGSKDRTPELVDTLARELPRVAAMHAPEPNYGRALRSAIETATGTFVVCDEIDLGDLSFYTRALESLRTGTHMVVGSKRHPDSVDARPWIRRKGTQVISSLLRVSLGFRGTDTHGLKAFDRRRLLPVVRSCTVEHDLFASELVIRAHRADLEVREVPLVLKEIRPPSVGLPRRVPRVLKNLARLIYTIRINPPGDSASPQGREQPHSD